MEKRAAMAAPWAGLVTSPVVWYAHQQGLGDVVYFRCGLANTATTLVASLAAVVLLALAGAWSASTLKARGPELPRFAALASLLAVCLFGLAILFQTLAGVIIPACAR